MKVVDIADEIYRDYEYPKEIDIPYIAYWIRANLGSLNNHLQTSYIYDESTLEIFDEDTQAEIGENEKAIIKQLFLIYFCEKKTRETLESTETDSIVSVSDERSSLTRIDKNAVAKNWISTKEQASKEIIRLVSSYKSRGSTVLSPLTIVKEGTANAVIDYGPKGVTGPTGPRGLAGQRGVQGVTGPTFYGGPTGAKGDRGWPGSTGATGPTGSIGLSGESITGPAGPKGDKGEKGNRGDTGIEGPHGSAGPIGPQGFTGPTGSQGYDGPRGFEGRTGPTGPAGGEGPTGPHGGPTGATGAVGATGTIWTPQFDVFQNGYEIWGRFETAPGVWGLGHRWQGPDGDDGQQGAVGPQGDRGPAGPTGEASTVAGPVGPTGADGETGAKGDTGPVSISEIFEITLVNSPTSGKDEFYINGVEDEDIVLYRGFTYKLNQTHVSNAYTSTTSGQPVSVGHLLALSTMSGGTHSGGSTYANGFVSYGTPGEDGYSLFTVPNDAPNTLYYFGKWHSDHETSGSISIRTVQSGPTGPTGPIGLTGSTGETGPVGPTGADSTVIGPTGPTGAFGYGVQGVTGPTGPDSTVAGPTGPTGFAGVQGVTGPTGADSTVAGPTGATGAVGTDGPDGAAGVTGPTGPTGAGIAGSVDIRQVWLYN